MKYNFDKLTDRSNTDSYKWDVQENELPMWVADMDFEVAPCIVDALQKRISKPIFGYSIVPEAWNEAYINWWERRHHFTMEKDWMIYTTGVIPALSSIVRKITSPNENVLIQTPVYNIFFNSIVNNGRHVLESPLVYDGKNYEIDFQDLEQKLADPQTSLMILCNPHNPVGKIWDKETLEYIAKLCHKYGVMVVSDEIHCDITTPNMEYVPFASVCQEAKDISITLIAPTKCFNMAGLQTAAAVVPNPFLRHKVWRGLNTDEVAEGNCFASPVAIAAFNEGEDWVDEMCEYVEENKRIASDYISARIPSLYVVPSHATYLLWIDCTRIKGTSKEICDFIRKETGLYLSEGSQYGKSGTHFIRMNLACPRERVVDGLHRFQMGMEMYMKSKNKQVD